MGPKETVFEKLELIKFEGIPSPKEDLKMLGDALNALSKPGLSKAEIQRWRNVVKAARIYQRLFREYMKYRILQTEIMQQLAETERR
jgi:hypothetical protein